MPERIVLDPGWVYLNLVQNPSAEAALVAGAWNVFSNTGSPVLARVADVSFGSANAFDLQVTASAPNTLLLYPGTDVGPYSSGMGRVFIRGKAKVQASAVSVTSIALRLRCFDVAGTTIGEVDTDTTATSIKSSPVTGTVYDLFGSLVPPAGTVAIGVEVHFNSTGSGALTCRVDHLMVVAGLANGTTPSYFDGSSTNARWLGTANGSASALYESSITSISRQLIDITPWISPDGVDWGDAEIQAYMAEQSRGAVPVDFRVPNRNVQIPLMLTTRGGTAFATARSLIQAKAAIFQREGGYLKRVTTAGGTVYMDVVNAAVTLGGGWAQSAKDYDTAAMLSLECSPDFYEDEITLADHVETTAAELVFTEAVVEGNFPSRTRVVVDNDDATNPQLGLLWSFRSKNYSSAATAATRYEAEALNPLDTAARAALTGASGGTVVTHGTVSTNWTPVLDMRGGGTAYPTHTGTNRLWVRYRTTSGTAVQLRAVWNVGDMVFPVENASWRHPGSSSGTALYLADLGELRLDPTPIGTHRWNATIQAMGDVGNENVSIDRVYVLSVEEGYGMLTASLFADAGLTAPSARDEFNQAAGTLNAKIAPVGGTWASAGATTDYSVESTGKTVQRTTSVAEGSPRLATLPVSLATVGARLDMKCSTNGFNFEQGLVARYVNSTNYLVAIAGISSGVDALVGVYTVVGGSLSLAATGNIPGVRENTWFTVALLVDATGRVFLFGGRPGGALVALAGGFSSALATGGTLATGGVGLYDKNPGGDPATRSYDNLAAWVATPAAVLHASQSAELRSDGMFRKDASGVAYGPVSRVIGDLPRLPPTVEGRTTEVFIKASRGDFDQLPDTGIDDISARITYRPCWLTVPE